jgi:hypothetical protein
MSPDSKSREAQRPPETSLGSALEAFIREHEYCGELASDVDDDRVWMTCSCNAKIALALTGVTCD